MVSTGNGDTNENILTTVKSSDGKYFIEGDVVVIGSGCAGLAAAWHLNRSNIDVQLFEADARAGGHANTVNGKNFRLF